MKSLIALFTAGLWCSVFSAAPPGETYNKFYEDGECIEGGIKYKLYHITTNVNLDPEYLADIIEFVGEVVIYPSPNTIINGRYKPWFYQIGSSLGKFAKPVKSIYIPDGVVKFSHTDNSGRFFWGVTDIEEIVFNKTDIIYPKTSEYYKYYYADESSLFRGCKDLKRVVLGKAPRMIIGNDNITSIIADDAIRNIASNVEELYYPIEYSDDWEPILKVSGCKCKYGAYSGEWTGLECVLKESGNLKEEFSSVDGYNLTSESQDRSIANVEIDSDTSIDSFVLKDGKVYDCAIRIVNRSGKEVKVKMPKGFVYEKFKGNNPLLISAVSTNILTITRTKADTFLLSREKLELETEE